MCLVIVKFAIGHRSKIIARGPPDNSHARREMLLKLFLRSREFVKWNSGERVVSGMLHNVVKYEIEYSREFDVRRAFDLALPIFPVFSVVEPCNRRMGVMLVNHESHKPVPNDKREQPRN